MIAVSFSRERGTAILERPTRTKHHLIASRIRNRIGAGIYRVAIPGQRLLAQEFGAHIITVRKATNALVNEGLLYTERGRGTLLAPPKPVRRYNIAAVVGGMSHGLGGCPEALLHGLQNEVCRLNQNIVFHTRLGDGALEIAALERVLSRAKCDGVLLWPGRHSGAGAVHLLRTSGIPFVVMMRADAAYRDRVSYVINDDFEGGFRAAKHLLSLGHRQIGFVARSGEEGKGDTYEEERWAGFVAAHAECGLSAGPRLRADWLEDEADGGVLSAGFVEHLRTLTGVVCVNDRIALRVMARPQNRMQTARAQAIVGYDDIVGADAGGLTTVQQPLREIGTEAVRLLFRQIAEPGEPPVQKKLRPRLVVRQTSLALRR